MTGECRAAGRAVGILTNDLRDFQTAEWIARMSFLRSVDVIVDGSVTGVLKPDRRAYGYGAVALGAHPADIVFLDDQRANVDAADKAGMLGVWFDVTDVDGSVERARRALLL